MRNSAEQSHVCLRTNSIPLSFAISVCCILVAGKQKYTYIEMPLLQHWAVPWYWERQLANETRRNSSLSPSISTKWRVSMQKNQKSFFAGGAALLNACLRYEEILQEIFFFSFDHDGCKLIEFGPPSSVSTCKASECKWIEHDTTRYDDDGKETSKSLSSLSRLILLGLPNKGDKTFALLISWKPTTTKWKQKQPSSQPVKQAVRDFDRLTCALHTNQTKGLAKIEFIHSWYTHE